MKTRASKGEATQEDFISFVTKCNQNPADLFIN